ADHESTVVRSDRRVIEELCCERPKTVPGSWSGSNRETYLFGRVRVRFGPVPGGGPWTWLGRPARAFTVQREVPAFCGWQAGEGSLLVVAPHAGVCERDLTSPDAAGLKSNDLYTAEVAQLLAERLGGSWIVNGARDRNDLDLNRVNEVAA